MLSNACTWATFIVWAVNEVRLALQTLNLLVMYRLSLTMLSGVALM